MSLLILTLPTKDHKAAIMSYKQAFIIRQEPLHGTSGLDEAASFEEWYQTLQANAKEETVKSGFVPATTYLVLSSEDHRLVGMVNIRHRLNAYLLQYGGHIGYSVRSEERGKGYGTEILRLALQVCRSLGLSNVLLTCDKQNIASRKIILKNGGQLESEIQQNDRIMQRYWISL